MAPTLRSSTVRQSKLRQKSSPSPRTVRFRDPNPGQVSRRRRPGAGDHQRGARNGSSHRSYNTGFRPNPSANLDGTSEPVLTQRPTAPPSVQNPACAPPNSTSRMTSQSSTIAQGNNNNNAHMTLRDRWGPTDRSLLKPGTILRAKFYEEAHRAGSPSPTSSPSSSILTLPGGWGDVCAKKRFFIVVATHPHNYVCLPLYTHRGQGLARKSPAARDEYVSVRDHLHSGPRGVFRPQSRHEPLETGELAAHASIAPTSTAWLTYPTSRTYDLPVSVQGVLTAESTRRLIGLFNAYAPDEDVRIVGGRLREKKALGSPELRQQGWRRAVVPEGLGVGGAGVGVEGRKRSWACVAQGEEEGGGGGGKGGGGKRPR